MTNKKIMLVFDVLLKFIKTTEYVVIPRADISGGLKGEFNEEEIESAINVLLLNELIVKSFADASVICLALTPKGVREMELREEAERQALVNEEMKKAKLMSAGNLPLASEKGESKGENVSAEEGSEDEEGGVSVEKTVVVPGGNVSYKKVIIAAALSAFFGALIPCAIALVIFLIKVG